MAIAGWLERHARAVHAGLAIAAIGAFAGSPFVAMAYRLPARFDWANAAHLAFGGAALVLTIAHFAHCTPGARWRLYFPWLEGRVGAITRDAAGLLRSRWPTADGGGLLATIEGLLLVAMLATGGSGVVWWFAQGSDAALACAAWHAVAAWTALALLALHVAGVALHWLDFVG